MISTFYYTEKSQNIQIIKYFKYNLSIIIFNSFQALARNIKKYELFQRNYWSMKSISLLCNEKSIFLRACVSVLSEFFGLDISGNSTVSFRISFVILFFDDYSFMLNLMGFGIEYSFI